MNALRTLTLTEMKMTLREPTATFFTLVFPLMLLVMFGSLFGNKASNTSDAWGAMDLGVQGYFAMIIGTVTLLGIPVLIAAYRQYRIFRRMRATPLRPQTIIASYTLANLAMTALGILLLLIGGSVLYDLRMPVNLVGVVVGSIISFMAFAAMGFLIGGLASTSRSAQVIGNVIYFPQLFLGGAAMPREMFPDTFRTWTAWLPMAQVVEVVGDPWRGEGMNLVSLGALSVTGLVAAAIASRVFRWE